MGLPAEAAVAGRVRLPTLRGTDGVDDEPPPAGLRRLPTPSVVDGGHDFPGYAETPDPLVPRDLWVTVQKHGASAVELQRILGLGSYVTAWTWLHKLRRAMVRPGRDRLCDRVEVDETYIGGLEEGVRGRQTETTALVAVACEEKGKGIGRIRLRRIDDASAASLHAFIAEAVEPGSRVHTDGWEGYAGLKAKGYQHRVTVLDRRNRSPVELLPRVHLVASLLKRWLLGTHQGAVSFAHLDYYLDEFTFRFHRRTSRSRGKLFYRLLQQAVAVEPAPYKALVGGGETWCNSNHDIRSLLESTK